MSEYSIRWDAENQHHIFVEHAERCITRAEVEQVMLSSQTVKWWVRGGRMRALGRTLNGRCLEVIYTGLYQLRPVSAWPRKPKECERWKI